MDRVSVSAQLDVFTFGEYVQNVKHFLCYRR